MPGPLGGLTNSLSSLKGLVAGGLITLGLIAITAALVALAAATIAATVALLKYGIAQADARRNELLRLEGLTKLRFWYRAAAGNAGEMQTAINRVSASSAVGRGKIAQYTEQLYKMGLRGQNLTDALEGVAIKAAVQGDAAASAFAGMAAGAALTGHSVKKLADNVKARLGGIAAKQMLSLGVQTEKLKESFDALFNGLKIEGFLGALNSITQLFSQNTETGRALKILMQGIVQPLINGLEKVAPIVKRFFQGMVIGALIFGIAILKVRNWLRDTFKDSSFLKGMDLTKLALYAGVAAVAALIAVVTALALALTLAAAPLIITATLIYGLYKVGKKLFDWWNSVDWSGLGTSIWQGIVNGIKSGAGWVINAVQNLGAKAWKAFKDKLGIASPSKVFAKLGLALPQGVQAGVERGSPQVDNSIRNMVNVPNVETIGGNNQNSQRPDTASNQKNFSVTIEGGIHIHTQTNEPQNMAVDIKRELEKILEGVVISMGGKIPT